MTYLRPLLGALSASVLSAVLLSPFIAFAQAYPAKPVRLLIPWPPGGSNDVIGRIVFQKVSESVGQPFPIDNRGGAAGTIGAALVAKSPPDGYTVMVHTSTHVGNAHLYKKLPYDTLKDFIGITPLVKQVGVLVVHPSLPVHSVKELVALAKGRPDEIVYASTGSGGTAHLAMALFNSMTKTSMVHVPYKGGGPAGIAIVGGESQALIASMAVVGPYIAQKRVRVLGVTSDARVKALPDVPTIAESVPGYESTAWVGTFVPAETPKPVVDKLSGEIKKALEQADVVKKLNEIAFEPMFMTPEQFAQRLKSDYDKYGKLIELAGAKAE
ncbi:MAG: Bug family tripartite tricarboxylate transporter substrate binding protein [Burkholderiales bacterium]